jgi:hypothetical protein
MIENFDFKTFNKHTYIVGATGCGKTVFLKNYLARILVVNEIPLENVFFYAKHPKQYNDELNKNEKLYTSEWIDLYSKLKIKDNWDNPSMESMSITLTREYPGLLIIDDFQEVINANVNKEYKTLLKSCRHLNITIVALVQDFDVGASAKDNISRWIVFPSAIGSTIHFEPETVSLFKAISSSLDYHTPFIFDRDTKKITRCHFMKKKLEFATTSLAVEKYKPGIDDTNILKPTGSQMSSNRTDIKSLAHGHQYNDNSQHCNFKQDYVDNSTVNLHQQNIQNILDQHKEKILSIQVKAEQLAEEKRVGEYHHYLELMQTPVWTKADESFVRNYSRKMLAGSKKLRRARNYDKLKDYSTEDNCNEDKLAVAICKTLKLSTLDSHKTGLIATGTTIVQDFLDDKNKGIISVIKSGSAYLF